MQVLSGGNLRAEPTLAQTPFFSMQHSILCITIVNESSCIFRITRKGVYLFMKRQDIEQLHQARLISDEQRRQIIEHFNLDKSRNWFLTVLLAIGGVLAAMGVILVISANWNEIPGLLKILCGGVLMAWAHVAGWWFRGSRQTNPKLGETFHFLGACMFMANIALVGQVYHLSSRTPNGFMLWLAGIIPLAWILRARSIHALSVAGLVVWMAMEINAPDGWLHFAQDTQQAVLYAGLGLLLYGVGQILNLSTYPEFAPATERFGLILFHLALWVTVLPNEFRQSAPGPVLGTATALAVPGLFLAIVYFLRVRQETDNRCKTWLGVLAAWGGLMLLWPLTSFGRLDLGYGHVVSIYQLVASVILIAGCLLQIRFAIEERAPWMVNLAIVTIAYTLIADFLILIGNMMNTGLIFLVGGFGLLALGYVLERKRRSVLRQIQL